MLRLCAHAALYGESCAAYSHFSLRCADEFTSRLKSSANHTHSGSTRVPQDLPSGRYGILDHGRDWVHHKAESVSPSPFAAVLEQ